MQSPRYASVIIATKDRSAFVVGAIESALCAKDVGEVIVVDDGSTDETPDRLRIFGDRIATVRGHFGSAAAARNAGASRARYPLIAFLDSDDEMLPDRVPAMSPCFSDTRVGLAHGRIEVMDETGRMDFRKTVYHEELFRRAESLGTGYADLCRHCALFTSATLIRKESFDDVNGYDESIRLSNEDLDLYLRMSLRWKLVYVHGAVARYRIWSGNFDSRSHAEGMLAVSCQHLRFLRSTAATTTSGGQMRGAKVGAVRRKAISGLYRRMAVSSQSLLRTGDTRRFLFRAAWSDPANVDLSAVRLFVASFVPEMIRRRRRSHLAHCPGVRPG